MKSISKKLKELPATAICGNDISSSCLYVSALAIVYAGQYAWISLLMVAAVLFLFRKVYGEVVGALPLNGGAYNALLNTTSKSTASLAAALTILSYMATAVISASEAMKYVQSLWSGLPVILATVGVLAIFMILVIIGIGESSKVAVVLFLFHLVSLVILSGFCAFYLVTNGLDVLIANFKIPVEGGITKALFFGFAAAMLGVSGFESSANYVEEQERGVFRKTLRNMWIIVTVFNPLLALLALAIFPISAIDGYQDALLSHMGNVSGGKELAILVSVDAALVLSGAVLTAFVGVGGLIERITLDRVMPPFLLKKNKRGNNYRIPILFFILCVSILLFTQGELAALAGVYTLAFLSVMVLFGLGNILLKIKRKHLPRPERSSWLGLFVAIIAVIIALAGNVIMNPSYLGVFLQYLFPTLLVIGVMLNRERVLRLLLKLVKKISEPLDRLTSRINNKILSAIDKVAEREFVFFTHHDDLATLNKVMLYIQQNEHAKKLKIVTVLKEDEKLPVMLKSDIEVLTREYPEIKIEFEEIRGAFGPLLIEELSRKWRVPINFMFIGSPGESFPHKIENLGGVRLVI